MPVLPSRRATLVPQQRSLRRSRLNESLLLALLGTAALPLHAAPNWFAASSQAGPQARAMQRAPMPGMATPAAARQQMQARQQLTQSIANLNRSANAIAAQQAAQEAARAQAQATPSSVPDGLGAGGLQVAEGAQAGWQGANAPTHTVEAGRHTVAIRQTADRAVLNWETFNVGRNTTLRFDQNASDAVLNKVVGASAAPSQIQGQIQAAGTVMVVNQNGVVFSGTSQVNVRNLVAAAAVTTGSQGQALDAQFLARGLYSEGSTPTFQNALGDIEVQAGARIATPAPTSATQGGGYVLLAGRQAHNAGHITTPSGQTLLAAGDSFVIAKGYGTEGSPTSTTRGNEVTPRLSTASLADLSNGVGQVSNTGLIQTVTGDITLTGREVTQGGVAIATTSTSVRGTIHLLNPAAASGGKGSVKLAPDSVTAIVLEDSVATAYDSQREAGRANPTPTTDADAPYALTDFRDLSRIEITSDNTVQFLGADSTRQGAIALATGGQIVVQAANRSLLEAGAELDVSGAVGVRVAMASNNLVINVQGNEQRDAPVNREGGNLNSEDVWLDRRSLIFVPAGTNGYETDRWYTAGGLLEVSGYLATSGRTVSEWMAQGGTVSFAGADVVTRAGSAINLSGGSLDVQDGQLRQTWLRGQDGRLYVADRAPADILYEGVYRGYEVHSARWGHTRRYYDPIQAPVYRDEAGYTVGRDAGKLVVGTTSAVLEGSIVSDVYQGPRQDQASQADLDALYQSHAAVARRGQLIIGRYTPVYYPEEGILRYGLQAMSDKVRLADDAERIADSLVVEGAVAAERLGQLVLDAGSLNAAGLGAIRIAAKQEVVVDGALAVSSGGDITLYAPKVSIQADLTARSGTIFAGNVLRQSNPVAVSGMGDVVLPVPAQAEGGVVVEPGVRIDVSGLTGEYQQAGDASTLHPYVDGGSVALRATHDVTLGSGSVIDASAGAVLDNKKQLQGGKGGSVRLGAGLATGPDTARLVLDGDIRALGVSGAGVLTIESRSAISIGGELLSPDNFWEAGKALPVDMIASGDFVIQAGERLPVDYSYPSLILPPGTGLPTTQNIRVAGALGNPVTLEADWTLPENFGFIAGLTRPTITSSTGTNWMLPAAWTNGPPTIPKGTVLTSLDITGSSYPGWTPPADVFPNGLPLNTTRPPVSVVVRAGNPAPQTITFAAGTRLTSGTVLDQKIAVSPVTVLDSSLFQSGFARYDVRGHLGLLVGDGVQITAQRPVLHYDSSGEQQNQPGAITLVPWQPPFFQDDAAGRALTLRQGASLSLAAGRDESYATVGDGGSLTIGRGAAITVDPGQEIVLASRGSTEVHGILQARGGRISLMGPRTAIAPNAVSDGAYEADGMANQRQLLIGEYAVLDVSAASQVTQDRGGSPYGWLSDGGSIQIGGDIDEPASRAPSSDAFVVIQPGATLNASGGSAWLDNDGRGTRHVASNGGRIAIMSASGIYLGGALRAQSGGAGALGGHLAVGLDAPNYGNAADNAVRAPRELVLHAERPAWDVTAGSLAYGHGAVGVDQVRNGGFSALTLFSNGLVGVQDDVSLAMPGELRIYAGALGLSEGARAGLNASFFAPYVLLAGIADYEASSDQHKRPSLHGGAEASASQLASSATLNVHADLLDIKGSVSLGAHSAFIQNGGAALPVDRAGFGQANLISQGDIRFVSGARVGSYDAQLLSSGSVRLAAQQVYPATQVSARVVAGRAASETALQPEGLLEIARSNDQAPSALPHSVFGSLNLQAARIHQAGVLRAPLGTLVLGRATSATVDTQSVVLAPGSETSVSAAGLIMPYGGTADGVSYRYQEQDVTFYGLGSEQQGTITLTGVSLDVQQGAVLDLSGGGELTGAGFVSGRGGSTDARKHALVQVTKDGLVFPGLASNPVYALVPGYAASYAPAWDGEGAIAPAVGQRVSIPAGVPGLPPGTYTLLPSQYALLPGAFRVEVNGGQPAHAGGGAARLRGGSYAVSGTFATAGTVFQASQPSQLIVTPASVLRTMSQYNETSYADFVRDRAAVQGIPRAMLPEDGKSLVLRVGPTAAGNLSFRGDARYAPAEGGFGGTASVAFPLSGSANVEIIGSGAAPTPGFAGVTLHAEDLSAIGAPRLVVGGQVRVQRYGLQTDGTNESNYLDFSVGAGSITLRQGAILRAPEVFLATNAPAGGITIEDGAGINTLREGTVAYGAEAGYVYRPGSASVLAASNAWLNVLAPEADTTTGTPRGAGFIRIGTCTVACAAGSELYSEGTLLAATTREFLMSGTARYGTRNLILAVSTVNAGDSAELAAASARGALTDGLLLNQGLLTRLLSGDQAYGAPALERLVLTAGQSFNFFGSVSLDTRHPATGVSTLDNLVLSTPAIYGYGQEGSVARISTDTLTWAGLPGAAPAPIAGGRGSGQGGLVIDANVIEMGYGPAAQPTGLSDDGRLILGFKNVALNAFERYTANHKGSLSVYESMDGVDADGPRYVGGHVLLTSPLVTGEGGSVNRLLAGGTLTLRAPVTVGSTSGSLSSGAELALQGDTVVVDTRIALPSGKLSIKARNDIQLASGAQLDLAGREVAVHDAVYYGWGGDVVLESERGNVLQALGSRIDVSARQNHAGTISAIALGASAGRVDLAGELLGTTTGHYDAGGTWVPYRAGSVDVRAQHLGTSGTLTDNFSAFNAKLTAGGIVDERRFQFKQGDLTIGNEVVARHVDISLDAGHLAVAGRIDASGDQVGSIRLAGKQGLTVAGTAMLDVHGALLRLDSYGKVIDAANRAVIDLNAGEGTLTLADGARMDLRYGTNDPRVQANPALHDQQNRGRVTLYAPRVTETGGDILVDAAGAVDIQGAQSIALYAMQRYDDSDPALVQRWRHGGATPRLDEGGQVDDESYREITQAYLKAKHDRSVVFIDAALGSAGLMQGKLAGLNNATYRDVFHLRPGVEINSADALVVVGDLDLSGHRYASVNPNVRAYVANAVAGTPAYGGGEAGALIVRAEGGLDILGSINDGFAPPPATPDDNGWVLIPGVQPFNGDVAVPIAGVQLADGTLYPKGKTLNFAVTARDVALPAGTLLPVAITLSAAVTLPAGTVMAADVLAADGSVLLAAGAVVPTAGLSIPANAQLQAGSRLPVGLVVARLTWPKGVALPANLVQQGVMTLPVGAILPAGVDVKLAAGVIAVPLKAAGAQAKNWALAPMLAEGSQSWDLRLVAGADTHAADSRRVAPDARGGMVFADTHYSANVVVEPGRTEPEYWTWAQPAGYTPPGGLAHPTAARVGERVTAAGFRNRCISGQYACTFHPEQVLPDTITGMDAKAPALSVVRTGTGNLDLISAGDVSMRSPFGVYTAGSQTSLGDAAQDARYNQARGKAAESGTVLGTAAGTRAIDYENLVSGPDSVYTAWYPDHGGDLRVEVGGNLSGDAWGANRQINAGSTGVGNWLWRQGTGLTDGVNPQPTSWWINFGTYAADPLYRSLANAYWPAQTGFTGLGTLGGGNLTVKVAGDAGMLASKSTVGVSSSMTTTPRSEALVLAVGSSGRVLDSGELILTGGGDLDLRIGGGWNSHSQARLLKVNGSVAQAHELYGAVVNLRGATSLSAGQIGLMQRIYGGRQGERDVKEVRATDPYVSSMTLSTGGLMMVAGDSAVTLSSRGDLVLGGTGDAGRARTGNYQVYAGEHSGQGGISWFTLWSSGTAIQALSAGGSMAMDTRVSEFGIDRTGLYASAGGWYMLPGSVDVAAPSGSIFYGPSSSYLNAASGFVLQAPMGDRTLSIVAGDSLYAGGLPISQSGADASAMATIFNPAFAGFTGRQANSLAVTNALQHAAIPNPAALPLLVFGLNTVGSEIGNSTRPAAPARFYAGAGDVVGLRVGGQAFYNRSGQARLGQVDTVGAHPVWVRAGRDIVQGGDQVGGNEQILPVAVGGGSPSAGPTFRGNVIVHGHANDVSILSAGRDILYQNLSVAGPGVLEISAGRNIVQEDRANLVSLGPVLSGDARPGASIVVQAGMGTQGADWSGFLASYLNPGNQAVAGTPLANQAGRVVKTYEAELIDWLTAHHGFAAPDDGSAGEVARAVFADLPAAQQRVFARQVYFAELRAGGREYNDADGPRFGSYLRGRNAIAALFPTTSASGEAIVYLGDLLLYGAAGIHTNVGGGIQILTPGGAQTYGLEGAAPPASAGLITRGQGDIELYSLGSILLGQSRIMTTFGGSILAWSAEGDINAGRGSKTTVVFTPPRRVYDSVGNVVISPDVPATGAGIATLAPIAEVPGGAVDLIAPEGTVDAGEAGIRSSDSVNIAALRVVNADNIQAQGDVSGVPMVAAVNIGALTNASAAASSAAEAAQDTVARSRAAARQALPSIISVQILGFGEEGGMGSFATPPTAPSPAQPVSYNPASTVQLVGNGQLTDVQRGQLTAKEQANAL